VSSNFQKVRHRMFEKVAANLGRFMRGEALEGIVDAQAGY
jgi:hypothetical protein